MRLAVAPGSKRFGPHDRRRRLSQEETGSTGAGEDRSHVRKHACDGRGGTSTAGRNWGRAPSTARPVTATTLTAASERRRHVAAIEAHITGTVWKVEVQVGDRVEEGDTVVILESMKMEMPVEAEEDGEVREVLVEEGQAVAEGDPLVILG
jgi:acetyl-CoA carboxylase biotin carboxyl carrier protein